MTPIPEQASRLGGAAPVWLVTGGAGYIGAHVVRALRAAGLGVVVVDDLSTGDAASLDGDVVLIEANVRDTARLVQVMESFGVTGVMHLAARKSVPESLVDPVTYFRENVDGTLSVVEAMLVAGVDKIVLASSAAVYGEITDGIVSEAHPTTPVSPYGESKLVSEWIVRDVARSHGIAAVALRYFNVAGAADSRLADSNGAGLIPAMVGAARSGRRPVVFGTSYATPDGSCVRDYVHVCDLAEAHVQAARRIGEWAGELTVLNLGSGRGTSVLEVAAAVCERAEPGMSAAYGDPRAGDVPVAVASIEAISTRLGWAPTLGLDAMVADQWDAWRAAPRPEADRVLVMTDGVSAEHRGAATAGDELGSRRRVRPVGVPRRRRRIGLVAAAVLACLLGLGSFGTQYAVAKGLGTVHVSRSPDAYLVVHPNASTRFDANTLRLLVRSRASVAVDAAMLSQRPQEVRRLAAAGISLINAGTGPPYDPSLIGGVDAIGDDAGAIDRLTGRPVRFYLAGGDINAIEFGAIRMRHEKIVRPDSVATTPGSLRLRPGTITLLECAPSCDLDRLLSAAWQQQSATNVALNDLAAAPS